MVCELRFGIFALGSGLDSKKSFIDLELMSLSIFEWEFYRVLKAVSLLMDDILLMRSSPWSLLSLTICESGFASNSTLFL